MPRRDITSTVTQSGTERRASYRSQWDIADRRRPSSANTTSQSSKKYWNRDIPSFARVRLPTRVTASATVRSVTTMRSRRDFEIRTKDGMSLFQYFFDDCDVV